MAFERKHRLRIFFKGFLQSPGGAGGNRNEYSGPKKRSLIFFLTIKDRMIAGNFLNKKMQLSRKGMVKPGSFISQDHGNR